MSRHRAVEVRPRYGRIAAAAASFGVTSIALLGGIGILPTAADVGEERATDGTTLATGAASSGGMDEVGAATGAAAGSAPQSSGRGPAGHPAVGGSSSGTGSRTTPESTPESTPQSASEEESHGGRIPVPASAQPVGPPTVNPQDRPTAVLPPKSGEGKRVVFSEARQRVWLVGDDGETKRTYLVSGSVTDNLKPGTYEVYSRSEQAYGIDDSGTMKWFVRFTTGESAAIGFHDIPVNDGAPVQTISQLGSPQSHGCIRQREADAKALWAFAPIGTTVVVTA